MIIIISEPADVHAQAVIGELKAIGVSDVRIFNFQDFPMKMSVTMKLGNTDRSDFVLKFPDGRSVPMDEVTAVWWRRPQAFGLPQKMEPNARHFSMQETATAFQGMWQSTSPLWVNNILRDAAASHKPWQLELARQLGLRIPDTLITNDPGEAREFWAKYPGHVVYKCFVETYHSWRETRILKPEEQAFAGSIRLAPVIFQEYIPAGLDLRITAIGPQLLATEADSQKSEYQIDVRLNNDIKYHPHQLPKDVEAKLLKMMRVMGLEYGAIDMRVTPQGEYVFLEVNPAGQFLYIEYAAKIPIARTLAAHLARGVETPHEAAEQRRYAYA
jgi:glutathione synthase/RimK-type ligase-like ATP-grasp enzyme